MATKKAKAGRGRATVESFTRLMVEWGSAVGEYHKTKSLEEMHAIGMICTERYDAAMRELRRLVRPTRRRAR